MPLRVVLTGANGVFGRHIAEGLVAAAYDVICICRSRAKGDALVASLREKFPSASVSAELCDVADRDQVRELAQRLAGTPVDILVNNAAVTPEQRSQTSAGIEQQWACNVLGYHWMLKELGPNLMASQHQPARVINVASFYAGGLDLSDPEFKQRPYDPDAAYRASKQANRMQSFAWSERHDPAKIVFFSCHPGVATSPVSLGLGFDLDRSIQAQRDGAKTPLHLCLSPDVPRHNGKYFADSAPQPCNFCSNRADVDKLHALLEEGP
jgi:NAD(P)-dependent dehydrogenase (short-subunit alcohol dehydrogenase family)